MPQVPATCYNCGLLFASGIDLQTSIGTSFRGLIAGPCPRCAGKGRILDGIYTALGDTLRILIDPTNPERIPTFLDALKQATAKSASPEELQQTIEKLEPQLTGLVAFLKDRENRKEVYIVVGLLIALLASYVKSNQTCPPSQIDNLVEQATAEAMAPAPAQSAPNRKARRTQQSRARHK